MKAIILYGSVVILLIVGCTKKEVNHLEPVIQGNEQLVDTNKKLVESQTGKKEPLLGEIGSSSRWDSGWIDFISPERFQSGDIIRIRIGGSAKKVLVRLLGKGQSPDSSVGIVGGSRDVPGDRWIEVKMEYDRDSIIQLSVHGGNPWGRSQGVNNGPATIDEIEVIRKQ